MTKKQMGILLMISSALSFALMQTAVSLCSEEITVHHQIFFRNLLGLFIAGASIFKNKGSYFGGKKYWLPVFSRAFCGWLGLILSFYALRHAAQADVSIILKTSPFFITIFSYFMLKEKFSKVQIPALIMVFLGGILACPPQFDSTIFPLLCAFATSLMCGIAYTLLRYFEGRVDGMTVIFTFSLFSTVASIPFIISTGISSIDFKGFLILIFIAITGSLGQVLITYSYRFVEAAEVSVYDQTGIIFAIILGYFVLGQTPRPLSLLGGAIIIAASVFIYFYNKKYFSPQESKNSLSNNKTA